MILRKAFCVSTRPISIPGPKVLITVGMFLQVKVNDWHQKTLYAISG